MRYKKFVIISDWLVTYITEEPYYCAIELQKRGWNIILLSQLNEEEIKKNECVVLFITYNDYDITKLKHENVNIIYKIDNLYPNNKIAKINVENADIVISPYAYLLKNKFKNISNNYEWIPYSCMDKYFDKISFNNNPINKIFVSGSNISNINPFRDHVFDLAEKHVEYFDSLKDCSIIREEYQKKLNSYLCCFADGSVFNYILIRIFEITASGCLLLTDIYLEPILTKLGFINGINCIMCNKEDILDKVKYILAPENRSTIDKIRLAGFQLSRKEHCTSKRAYMINSIATNFTLTKYTQIVELFDKSKMYILNDDLISDTIRRYKVWDHKITQTVIEILKQKKGVFLDAGCNIGFYSLIAAKYCTKVYSFDANETVLKVMKKSIDVNNYDNIFIINKCISDFNNETFEKANFDAVSKNKNIGALQYEKKNAILNYGDSVKSITLDTFIKSQNINEIQLLKIDIEGGEKRLLLGLKENLQKKNIKYIIFEFSPIFDNFTTNSLDVLNILSSYNYKIYNIGVNCSTYCYEDPDILSKIKMAEITDFVGFTKRTAQTDLLAILQD